MAKVFQKKKSLNLRESDMRKLYTNKENERFNNQPITETQRMLFRLMSLNIIDDYSVNFTRNGIYSYDITLSDYSPESIKESLKKFLLKYDTKKDVEIRMNKFSSILSLVEKLNGGKPINLMKAYTYR